MARKIHIDPIKVQKAKHLRDQATTVGEYRKALSVILVADTVLMQTEQQKLWAQAVALFIAIEAIFAIKATHRRKPGVVCG